MLSERKRRTKVYQLEKGDSDDSVWADKGTGHATFVFDNEMEYTCIEVICEKDNSVLLYTRVHSGELYHKERDTLIVWQDPLTDDDLALSFSDKDNCKEFWDEMVEIQQRLQETEPKNDYEPTYSPEFTELASLHPVNLENLQKIYLQTKSKQTSSLAASLLTDANYIDRLFTLAEGLDDEDLMRKHLFFGIFKNIILLNEPSLLEILFKDENILRLLSILEHDPDIHVSKRINHREFVSTQTVFKEVVPIADKFALSKIHHTFRVKYLKDSVLMGALDDSTLSTINTIVFYNNYEIVTMLQEDSNFLNNLFSAIKNSTPDDLLELVDFLKQFCDLSKNLSDKISYSFTRALIENGLTEIFEIAFATSDPICLQNTIDIFCQTMLFRDIDLREFILGSAGGDCTFLRVLSERLKDPFDFAVLGQIVDIFRRLVDTENIDPLWRRKEEFMSIIYKYCFPKLLLPYINDDGLSIQQCACKAHLYDLLSFCIPRHGTRIRSFITSNNIFLVSSCNFTGPGYLILAVIRLHRKFVMEKTRKTESYIISLHAYDPIMKLLSEINDRYNMVNSAIIELFEFIAGEYETNHRFIAYLVERYRIQFESIHYVDTFKELIQKYEKHVDFVTKGGENFSLDTNKITGKRKREEEEDEDAYFDLDSEQPNTPPLSNIDEENSIGAGLTPLTAKNGESDDSDEEIVPARKKRKLEIRSISYHKDAPEGTNLS